MLTTQQLATRLLGRSGLADLARMILVRSGRFALNFHGVSSRRYPGIAPELQPHHTREEFRQTLLWLSTRFDFLSPEEFLHTARPGVLLTFDDGHANNLTNILPVLSEFHAPGLFFITVQHVRRPRDWLPYARDYARRGWGSESAVPDEIARDCYDGLSGAQLRELAGSPWAVIGSHTLTHPHLPNIPLDQATMELKESRRHLQELSGQSVDCFAYPFGDYNAEVALAACLAGYRAAFAVIPRTAGLPAFEIPRVDLYSADPGYLSVKLSGLYRPALRGPILS